MGGYITTVGSVEKVFAAGQNGAYSSTITNTKKEADSTRGMILTKVWLNADGTLMDNPPTDSITATLYADGEEYRTVTISEANGWKETVESLPVRWKGETADIKWTVKESAMAGYFVIYGDLLTEDFVTTKKDWTDASAFVEGEIYWITSGNMALTAQSNSTSVTATTKDSVNVNQQWIAQSVTADGYAILYNEATGRYLQTGSRYSSTLTASTSANSQQTWQNTGNGTLRSGRYTTRYLRYNNGFSMSSTSTSSIQLQQWKDVETTDTFYTIELTNRAGTALPSTRGTAILPYILSGLIFLSGALIYGYILHDKKKGKEYKNEKDK